MCLMKPLTILVQMMMFPRSNAADDKTLKIAKGQGSMAQSVVI